MKFVIITLAAVLSLALAEARDNLYEKPGYKFDMRRRLGHFAEAPFTDLYKEYAVAFIAPNYDSRPADDYRNFRPSADVCRSFFAGFVGHKYEVEDLDQVIVLDACLGYVLDGVYQHDPDATEDNKSNFAALAEDEKLVKLYQTKLNEFGAAEKTCVADLLLNSVLAKKQYPDQECNNHMLQMYIQFAECQKATPMSEFKESDSYVNMVYGLVKERVNRCVDVEVKHIEEAVRARFGNEWFKRSSLVISRTTGGKQQKDRKWPTAIVTLLGAVQNIQGGEINLRQVHQLLASVQHGDDKLKSYFLKNIAEFADRKIKPSGGPAKPKSEAFNDPRGNARYKKLIDKVCNHFRSSDSEKDYDFATPIIRMVELLNHTELFGFDRESFVEKMLTHSHESGPLYLSVSACNMLTFTEGTYQTTGQGKPHYEVHFQPDTSKMVTWPKADYV